MGGKKRKSVEPPSTEEASSVDTPFKVGDSVIVKDLSMQYEAKILKVKTMPTVRYFVHFQGWNSKWDSWADPVNISTIDAASKQRMMINNQKVKDAVKEGKKKKTTSSGASKKEELDANVDYENDESADAFKLQMQAALQRALLLDVSQIEENKLMSLPRSPCVADIIEDFKQSTQKKKKKSTVEKPAAAAATESIPAPAPVNTTITTSSSSSSDLAIENQDEQNQFLEGLTKFFDHLLPMSLLYRVERLQYNDLQPGETAVVEAGAESNVESSETIASQSSTPVPVIGSKIYGAEHFLRLFIRVPQLISLAGLEAEQVAAAKTTLNNILKFLDKNHAKYFNGQYEPATEDYLRRVEDIWGKF